MVVSHEASRTGAPRVAVEILTALADLDVERIAMVRWPGPMLPDFHATGAAVRLEPLRRVRVALRNQRRTRRLAVPVEQFAAYLALRRRRPDVLYLNTVKSASYVRAAKRLGIPTILHTHEGLTSLLQSTLERYRFSATDWQGVKVVASSEFVRQRFVEFSGVSPESVDVLYLARDVDEIRRIAGLGTARVTEPRGLVVGSLGTADETKGVDRWVRLAARVKAVAPDLDVRWAWIGSFDPATTDQFLESEGMADDVTFHGVLDNVYPDLQALDVYTTTARFDAFPLAVLEAMILGRAVAGFDVGGVAELVGDAGVLVPDGDVDALADVVVRLLRDPDLRAELGARASQRAEALFSVERFRSSVRTLVESALVGPVRPGGGRPSA